MTVSNISDGVYTDFKGLTQLQYKAANNGPSAINEVGRQFEAIFIQMMLKSMRQATPGDPLLGSQDQSLYRDLFDKQISLSMASKSQTGIANLIVEQLRENFTAQQARESANQNYTNASNQKSDLEISSNEMNSAVNRSFQTPKDFVENIWPYAKKAAEQLNVNPRVLVAQAALETGWGRYIITRPDGTSTNNLFGIKAGQDWQHDKAFVATLEFHDGIAVKEQANFRAYDSLAQGFQDYVEFLKSNPRYSEALSSVNNPNDFSTALQDAGYATDPDYSKKINDILNGDTLALAMADLKENRDYPIA